MPSLNYNTLGETLVAELPELRQKYDAELDWWGGDEPGAHNMFSAVLNPFLISLLASEEHVDTACRVFALLEKLSSHEDVRVREVVGTTVLERLAAEDKGLLVKARKYMQPKTLQMSHDLEKAWGREA